MKSIAVIFAVVFSVSNIFAQNRSNLEQLIETEKSFAAASDEKGIKSAFLTFLADDAIVFSPTAVNGKERFRGRPDNSPASLAWYPVFADVSANGALGYTTGRGEFRPDKSGTKIFYSEFATVWRRQPDGNYKAVLDIGISHDKSLSDDKTVASPPQTEKFSGENKPFAANFINAFFDAAATKSLSRAYKTFAADDARFLREGKFPVLGKANAPGEPKKNKIYFGKNMTLQSAGDLAYSVTTFQMNDSAGKTTEKGNLVQIWKLRRDGNWQIVLDVMSRIPLEQK